MSFPIPCLQKLLYEIQKWPGIGPRSAGRLIAHLLKNKDTDIPLLVESLQKVHTHIKRCSQCLSWAENTALCSICSQGGRDASRICVVENPFDVFRIENSRVFHGYYHVLHGMISPLHNIAPEDLAIEALIEKIQTQPIKEVILALDTHLEGDTTVLYLLKKLKPFRIKISKPAEGIPLGSHLDFIDDRTLSQALENRIELET